MRVCVCVRACVRGRVRYKCRRVRVACAGVYIYVVGERASMPACARVCM